MIKISTALLIAGLLLSTNIFFASGIQGQEGPIPQTASNATNTTSAANTSEISPIPAGPMSSENLSLILDNKNLLPLNVEEIGNNSYLFQGDILLSKPVSEGRVALDKFILSDPWPNGVIPYKIDPNIPNQERIVDAIQHWEANTPIRFVEVDATNPGASPNYVSFVYNPDPNPADDIRPICASNVGMIGGEQQVLVPDWCRTGSIIHEIGHVAGLWHEQTRCDRDDYIELHLENVDPESIHNWENLCLADPNAEQNNPQSPVGFGQYDYCSIEHYGRTAGSINGLPVLVPKQPITGCDDIGQRNGLSESDVAGVQSIYR